MARLEDFNPVDIAPGAGKPPGPVSPMPTPAGEPVNLLSLPSQRGASHQEMREGASNLAGAAARYGIPTALAATGIGAVPLGLSMGASHLLANQLEQGAHVPSFGEGVEAGVVSTVGTAAQLAVPPLINITGAAIRYPVTKLLQRVIVPPEWSEITSRSFANTFRPTVVELPGGKTLTYPGQPMTAENLANYAKSKLQKAFGNVGSADFSAASPMDRSKYYLYKWLDQMGSSPLPGQVFKNEWVQFMDQVTSVSLFTGTKAIRQENAQRLTDAAINYVNAHGRAGWQEPLFGQSGNDMIQQVARSRFGQLAQAVFVGERDALGRQIPGSLINMQSLINGANYQAVRREIEGKGMEISSKPILDWFAEHEAANPHVAGVATKLAGKIPKPPPVNALGLTEEQMGKVGLPIEQLQNMSPKVRSQIFDAAGVTPGPQEATMSMEQAMQFIQEDLNKLTRVPDKGTRAVAYQLKDTLEDAMEKEMLSTNNTEALQAFNYARKTFGTLADTYDNTLIQNFISTLNENPAASFQAILGGQEGSQIGMFDALKKAYLADTKGAHGGGTLNFTENVVKPLRYHPFALAADEATGQVNGEVLYKTLNSTYGQEFGERVYGQEVYNDMKRLALAIIENDKKVGAGSMFIKGAQTAAVMGGGYMISQRENLTGRLAGASLLLSPIVAARVFAGNPAATKALIEGITMGRGSTAWTRAAAVITAEAINEEAHSESLTPGQRQVYTDPASHKIVDPSTMPQPEFHFVPSDQSSHDQAARQQLTGEVPEAPPVVMP